MQRWLLPMALVFTCPPTQAQLALVGAKIYASPFSIAHTLAIRNRIKKGDVSGPVIYTRGAPLVPRDGSPFYIRPYTLREATGFRVLVDPTQLDAYRAEAKK